MTEFRLPDVGEGLDQAEIVEWLVEPGQSVARDQPLVEILTDKSQTQLPSPQAGVISRLGFEEGDMAQVGEILVEFGELQQVPDTPATPTAATPTAATPTAATPTAARPKASPVVRRRAVEAGLDLSTVPGSGPGGRITAADLDTALAGGAVVDEPEAGPPPAMRAASRAPAALARNASTPSADASSLGQLAPGSHPLRGIRRVTAEAMAASWQIPHIHGQDELDATNLLAGRRKIKELHGSEAANLTPLPFFVSAVANAMRRFPLANASITGTGTTDGAIVVHPDVNIGIAVATEKGLIVPVVRNADRFGLLALADEIARLSAAARDRSITADQLRNGTCTVSNYGSLGGRFSTPIIRAPEVMIVGFGSIRKRPFVVDGHVMARPTLPVSTAADHRIIDGDLMTAIQEHVISLLTDPVALLI